jgi:hypothetical protein
MQSWLTNFPFSEYRRIAYSLQLIKFDYGTNFCFRYKTNFSDLEHSPLTALEVVPFLLKNIASAVTISAVVFAHSTPCELLHV